MGQRIFLYAIVLGSLCYGALAIGSVLQTWRMLPHTVRVLEHVATSTALTQAHYLRSPWYHGQLALTLATGALFIVGAVGLWRRRTWSRLTLFGGAWLALAQMAWTLVTSMEWFRTSGMGMLYQINLLNVAWVLLILAVAPTERLLRS